MPNKMIIIFFMLSLAFSSSLFIKPAMGQDSLKTDDAFENMDDEFESFNDSEVSQVIESENEHPAGFPRGLKFGLGALVFTIMAGIMVRFRTMRYFRTIFLLGSLVILGFMNGGCPCSISSFQNLWLWLMGQDVKTHTLIWFLALIPITYIFGKVWCGWVCHLGAFQEFLYRTNKIKFLKSEKTQKILKILLYVMFAALMIQLFVTKTNIFIHYDPFKVAFNLTSYHKLGWILLGILLLTSLFIYRPFCRGVCPVGLVLGWVSKIPGALKLQANDHCTSCRACTRNCLNQSIDTEINFKSQDCIMCGECLDNCKKGAIYCER